jgi:hypothetical protein
MRYYSYNELPSEDQSIGDKGFIVTLSEKEILEQYYPHWYRLMCKRYGQEYVDTTFSFEDCLDDWCVLHWAWKSK